MFSCPKQTHYEDVRIEKLEEALKEILDNCERGKWHDIQPIVELALKQE